MPLPTALILAFASGLAAAIAGRVELKVSPRPALLTRSALAFLMFDFLVLVPASAYFYVFHGDWFLLYVLDVRQIPSAVALVGFLFQGAVAAGGFAVGAGLVRAQREILAGGILAGTVVAGAGTVFAASERLSQVGTYAQYHGRFGLVPFTDGPLLIGTIVMSTIIAVGLGFLLVRIGVSARCQR